MREIKFRFFVPGHGMAYGTLSEIATKQLITSDDIGKVSFSDPMLKVMQYTGLKDKNGVEIYEGDIVLREYASTTIVEYGVQEVDAFEGFGFNLWGFSAGSDDKASRLSDESEVIGNIYKNPELMKEIE